MKMERKKCDNVWIGEKPVYREDANSQPLFLPNLVSSTGSAISRFTILDDRLYAVTDTSLIVFDISDPSNIQEIGRTGLAKGIDDEIETIYPLNDYLMLGAMNGMYIMDINDRDSPVYLSSIEHMVSCDPVVADQDLAYVTLRSSGRCPRNGDRLEIISIQDIENPEVLERYDMESPGSLALDEDILFVITSMDDDSRLSVLNVNDIHDVKNITTLNDDDYVDIILVQNTAFALGQNGFYIYDYTDPENISLKANYIFSPAD